MKKNILKATYTLAIYVIVIMAMLTSCGEPVKEEIPTGASAQAQVTIYMPDGTEQVIDVYNVQNGSNSTRLYWTEMDGTEHNTTLQTKVDFKYKQ